MLWITRARPKIDRVACPWLVARHIDPDATFLFVEPGRVHTLAAETGGIPYVWLKEGQDETHTWNPQAGGSRSP